MLYDLIVIGGGPGGYYGALQAAAKNMKTVVIEERKLGGVCLNEGCIPTKTFLHSAKIYRHALKSETFGVTSGDVRFHHDKVLARKNDISQKLGGGIRSQLRGIGVELKEGRAQLLERQADGIRVQVEEEVIHGKQLLLATGASPAIPPIPGLRESMDQGIALTSKEILDIPQLPSSLIIIGGGIIGLEMAEYFVTTGSRVTVIEMQEQIGGNLDREVADTFLKIMQKKGIQFELSAKVLRIDQHVVHYKTRGNGRQAEAEHILVCTGRKPNVEGFGLERLGVETARGAVITDDRGKTNIPNVYAAGDINGKAMLAHTAYREAEVCINNMSGMKDIVRYRTIPSVVYTSPEIAFVGETEETAKKKGIDFAKVKLPLNYSGRYQVEAGDPDGFVKVLIERTYNQIIGVHIIGNYAAEMIYGAAMMLETEMRVEDVKELVFPHPSVSEMMKEAIQHYK